MYKKLKICFNSSGQCYQILMKVGRFVHSLKAGSTNQQIFKEVILHSININSSIREKTYNKERYFITIGINFNIYKKNSASSKLHPYLE